MSAPLSLVERHIKRLKAEQQRERERPASKPASKSPFELAELRKPFEAARSFEDDEKWLPVPEYQPPGNPRRESDASNSGAPAPTQPAPKAPTAPRARPGRDARAVSRNKGKGKKSAMNAAAQKWSAGAMQAAAQAASQKAYQVPATSLHSIATTAPSSSLPPAFRPQNLLSFANPEVLAKLDDDIRSEYSKASYYSAKSHAVSDTLNSQTGASAGSTFSQPSVQSSIGQNFTAAGGQSPQKYPSYAQTGGYFQPFSPPPVTDARAIKPRDALGNLIEHTQAGYYGGGTHHREVSPTRTATSDHSAAYNPYSQLSYYSGAFQGQGLSFPRGTTTADQGTTNNPYEQSSYFTHGQVTQQAREAASALSAADPLHTTYYNNAGMPYQRKNDHTAFGAYMFYG